MTSPDLILENQNSIKDVFVANILRERHLAVGRALEEAKNVSDISKLVGINLIANKSLDFIWQQSMYSGIRHCEEEISKQAKTKSNFSLSYGVSDIIEFSSKSKKEEERLQTEIVQASRMLSLDKGSQDEFVAKAFNKKIKDVTAQDRNSFKKGLEDRISENRVLLKTTSKVAERITKRDVSEEGVGTPGKNLSQEKNKLLSNAFRRRDTARKKITALKKKQQNILSSEERNPDPYELTLNRLGLTTQEEINKTLSNRYSALSSKESFSQDYLNGRKLILSTQLDQSIRDDIQKKVANYVSSSPGIKNQKDLIRSLAEIYRGTNQDEYKNSIKSLSEKEKNLKQRVSISDIENSKNVLENVRPDLKEDIAFEVDTIKKSIKAGEPESERVESRLNLKKFREQMIEAKTSSPEFKTLSQSNNQVYKKILKEGDRLTESIERREVKSNDLREDIESLENSLENTVGKDKIRSLKKGINKKKQYLKRFEKDLDKSRGNLNSGKYGLNLNKGAKVSLSKKEKESYTKLLKLTKDSAREDLDKEFTATDLKKLKDRIKRKSDVFNDESVASLAEKVAVTEVSNAYNIGRLQVFLSKGIKYVQWVATLDSKTSVFCQSLHKKVFSLQDIFKHVMYNQIIPKTREPEYSPHNKSISSRGIWIPAVHPYCRSYFQPVYLPEDEKKLKQDLKNDALEKQLVTEGKLAARGKDKSMRGLLKKQDRQRKADAAGYLRDIGSINYLFRSGLDSLTKKINTGGDFSFKVEDILRDDKRLSSTLMSASLVMSTSSLVYFFLRGNLSGSIKSYSNLVLRDAYTNTTDFVGSLTKKEAAKITKNIIEELNDLPKSILDEFNLKGVTNEKYKEEDLDNVLSAGKMGYDLAMNGIPINTVASSLSSNNLLKMSSKKAIKNKLYTDIINRAKGEVAQMNRDSLRLMNSSLGNMSLNLDPTNIASIEMWDSGVAIVKFNKGKPTFISQRKLQNALSSNKFRSQIDATSSRATEIRKMLKDLEKKSGTTNPVLKAKIRKEIDQLDSLVKLKGMSQLKATPLVRDAQKELDQVFSINNISRQELVKLQDGISEISNAGSKIIKDLEETIPDRAKFNVNVEKLVDSENLSNLNLDLDKVIKTIESKFINTEGEKFRVKKIEDIINVSEVIEDLQRVDDNLKKTNLGIDYRDTLKTINSTISQQISNEYTFLLSQKAKIEKRLKEL